MSHTLTITLSDEVYRGLHERLGETEIGPFIENLVRSNVVDESELAREYREAAQDEQAERDAKEWIEAILDDGLRPCNVALSIGPFSIPRGTARRESTDQPESRAIQIPVSEVASSLWGVNADAPFGDGDQLVKLVGVTTQQQSQTSKLELVGGRLHPKHNDAGVGLVVADNELTEVGIIRKEDTPFLEGEAKDGGVRQIARIIDHPNGHIVALSP